MFSLVGQYGKAFSDKVQTTTHAFLSKSQEIFLKTFTYAKDPFVLLSLALSIVPLGTGISLVQKCNMYSIIKVENLVLTGLCIIPCVSVIYNGHKMSQEFGNIPIFEKIKAVFILLVNSLNIENFVGLSFVIFGIGFIGVIVAKGIPEAFPLGNILINIGISLVFSGISTTLESKRKMEESIPKTQLEAMQKILGLERSIVRFQKWFDDGDTSYAEYIRKLQKDLEETRQIFRRLSTQNQVEAI
jgi:hypothetical protein